MRPVVGALPLVLAAIASTVPATMSSFAATTTSPANDFTNLVVQPATLAAPVTQSAGYIHLSWTASPTAASQSVTYGVLRSYSGLGMWSQVTTLTGLSYADLPPFDGWWDYEIQTIVSSFTSNSNLHTGLSDRTPPSAASAVTAKTGTLTGDVNLTWTAGSDSGSGVAGYTIRYVQATTCPTASPSSYPSGMSVGAVTAATVSGLTTRLNYCFYLVTSDNAGNVSGASNVASAKAK